MSRYILSVLVQNHAGVLSKVAGLFSRRGFNINSLAVGVTEDESISRITITVDGDEYVVDQVAKQLDKLIDVIKVKLLSDKISIRRELLLLKVKATSKNRQEIIQISNIFRAKVVDISHEYITMEITGNESKLEAFIEMLMPFGIDEIVRTGMLAIERGENVLKADD